MRPIVCKQDPLRYPLNELFGTRAHVRLLRVMANEVDGPLSVSDVADRAGLTVPGAQKALEKLFKAGFISRVGGGRKRQYEILSSDKLMQITLALFQAERDRYEQLLTTIKEKVKTLTPHPYAAWIQTFPMEIGEPLKLGLLHETRHLTNCVCQLRTKLNQVEKDFDITIELAGYTKADLPDLKPSNLSMLYGVISYPSNSAQLKKKNNLTHKERDRRQHELSSRLAEAIEQDASLLKRAKDHIARLLQEEQGPATRDLMEWRDILDLYTSQRLTRFITSSTERANRLRRSNPFFAVLNFNERGRLSKALKDDNET